MLNLSTVTMSASLIFSFSVQASAGGELWAKSKLSDTKSILHLTGKVVPQDGALFIASARVQGRIINFLKREGDFVKDGTPIYTVSSAECQSLAEEKRVAGQKKMQDLIDAVNRRERQLGLLLDGIECKVISSSSGVIVKRNIEIGSAFNPGDILATIVDTHRLTVELEVPEGEISKVKPNDIVHVKIAGSVQPVIGSVDVIVPTIDSGTRTSKIRLKNIIINNGSIESLVTADLELMGQSEKALIIPQSALVFYKNKHYVLKRTNQDPEIVSVQILTEIGTTSLVRADEGKKLTENDEILQEGAIFIFNKLHSGILK